MSHRSESCWVVLLCFSTEFARTELLRELLIPHVKAEITHIYRWIEVVSLQPCTTCCCVVGVGFRLIACDLDVRSVRSRWHVEGARLTCYCVSSVVMEDPEP